MDATELLAKPTLKVYESGHLWKYTMKRTSGGFPFYIAPKEKQALHKTALFDDALFLPITTKEYQKYQPHNYRLYWGYRYIFGSCGMTTVDMQNAEDEVYHERQFKLGFEASRIRYFFDDDEECDIIIEFMGDGLFPTRMVSFTSVSDDSLSQAINDVILTLIDEHCKWYLVKEL